MTSTLLSLTLVICALAGVSLANFHVHYHPSSEELLVDALLKQYEASRSSLVIPGPVTVTIGMQPLRVVSLKERVLTMVVWNQLSWNDHRLAWENDDEGDVTGPIQIPVDQIWTPDLTAYTGDALPQQLVRKVNAMVYSDGNVTFYPAAKIRVFCKEYTEDEDHEYFTCQFKVGSWTYSTPMIDLAASNPHLPLDDFEATDWDIVSSNVTREEITYSCCPESYVGLIYSLKLKGKN